MMKLINHNKMFAKLAVLRPVALPAALVGTVLCFSATAQAFNLNSNFWEEGETTMVVDLAASNPAGSNPPNVVPGGPTTAQLQAAYLDAMTAWNSNSVFVYNVDTGSGAEDPCPSPSNGGGNGVQFSSTECGDSWGSSTLAIQQHWFNGSKRLQTGTIFNNTTQWDLYNGNYNGTPEFKRVAIHELGHGLGLGHEDGVSAIMNATIGDEEGPQTDDVAGVAALYDSDSDGIGLVVDNCPSVSNSDQANIDGDALGDVCDNDIDGDGVWDGPGIDVSNGPNLTSGSLFAFGPTSGNSFFPYASQSFIAGTGAALSSVGLPIYCPSGSLTVSIRNAVADTPTTDPALVTQTFSAPLLPSSSAGRVQFDFTSAPLLVSGNQYAIVLQSSGECRWFINNGYTSGEGFLSTNNSSWDFILVDFGFDTEMTPSPVDNCAFVINPLQTDSNSNGVGDACEVADSDGDGIDDGSDNCPAVPNPGQQNNDGDSQGDACDSDDDNDGLSDLQETGTYLTNPFIADTDGDGVSDGDEVAAGTNPLVGNYNVPLWSPLFALFAAGLLFAGFSAASARRTV